uniref:Sema domain-containing protein n=1 Tax=Glossina pallidipes TaxID=7398 RepID=A0A1A9ZXZ1_GLOPL
MLSLQIKILNNDDSYLNKIFHYEKNPTHCLKKRKSFKHKFKTKETPWPILYFVYANILIHLCKVDVVFSVIYNTKLVSTNINSTLQKQQFLSNDIVAQFSLPQTVGIPSTNSSTTTTSSNVVNASYGSSSSGVLHSTNYFTHLAYDEKRKVFYAGVTNKILQLNENLRILSQAITGPKQDSPQCHASGCSDDVETTLVNNHNKILIVSYAQNDGILISCGSVRQGACDIYNLSRFPNNPQFIDVPLAANDEFASTYAFVGPAEYSWKKEDILYVGTTFTNVGDYRHDVPAISSRRLDDLNYAEFEIKQSIINIDVKYRDDFLVDYVYGFNSSEYAYFAIVQKKSHLAEEAGYITRLARICITDSNYDSYTEITIQCLATAQSVDYNILRAAKITEAGQKLAQQMGIKRDDYILMTIFSPSLEITNQPGNKSAMCIYSLKAIEEVFDENIHLCFNGTIKDRNLGYISGTIDDGRCPSTTSNVYSFCNVGLKISGVAPITSHALFHFSDVSVTSVTATTTGPHTLAFLGTEHGSIKKVLLSGQNPGEYEEITIDPGNMILQDTFTSPRKDFLYVLSMNKITKLKIEHCSLYTNCSACLESRDPFCGWCSLEKRCTIRSTCQKDTAAARWLSLGSGQQCIDFESILPDKLPITDVSKVQLLIKTLPEPVNGKYRCVFGNSTPIDAEVLENGLACNTPPLDQRPIIAANMDHVLVPLSVRSSETNKDFVSRSFSFFDCSRHSICRTCVRSFWSCNWCVFDNKCIHKSEQCRNLEKMVSKDFECPHLKRVQGPLLLPVRVPKEIRLEIENLPRPKNAHSGFLCTVQIEAAQMLLPARIEANRFVVCEKTPYFYETNTYEYEAKVDITWNRQHYIDTALITLYKCDVLGSHREHADCSLCVTRDSKYQCAWCGNSCVYNDTCSSMALTTDHGLIHKPSNYPLSRANDCPRPRIDMIKPLFGPIEGGTLVTIEGSNLGIKEEDVRGKISIGNVPCELVNYEISVKIECRTGGVNHEITAPVKVFNDAGFTESSVQFQFKDIQLIGLHPRVGPKSGGTQISLMGKYLNIGSNIRAFLDEYECHINMTKASSSRLTCVTSEATQPEPIRTLRLFVDGANRTYTCENHSERPINAYDHQLVTTRGKYAYHYHSHLPRFCSIYNYTHDPTIMEIKPLRSFASGGRLLTVHGMYLDSIQNPELEVFFGTERINKTTCVVINASQMECPSPVVNAKFWEYKMSLEKKFHQGQLTRVDINSPSSLHIDVKKRSTFKRNASFRYASLTNITSNGYFGEDIAAFVKVRETQLNLQVGFVMDNVQWVRDLGKYFSTIRSSIAYVSDPKYHAFPEGIKLYKGDTLVIEGELLNIASDESDVNVTIGTGQCNVTSLTLTQLLCTPPEKQPIPTDESGLEQKSDFPLVVVKVGRNLRFVVGHLKYDLMKAYSFSHAIWGIIFTISLVVILLIIVLVIYRRKTTQAEREYKRIQIQMITLESNVRSECKQAFAELQTDMTDLTADLETSGIPTLNHVNYIMKVFFPGVSDHPILNSPKLRMNSPHTNYDAAMLHFEQLISNKYFVLTFIESLEGQKSFNIRDNICRICVRSFWSCNWCVFDNKCIHKSEQCRNLEKMVSKDFECPHLKRVQGPLLLPVRVPKEIRLEIENLPRPKNTHSGFLRTVQIEAAQMLLPARIEANRFVVCEKTPYFYETNTYEYEAKVDITWNRQHYIDTALITLYKCDVLGSHREHADCSLCVIRDSKYQCAWCGNSCVYNDTCSSTALTTDHGLIHKPSNYPLSRANDCPRPRIDMIKPLFGPIEGGTLRRKEEDVRGKISIGNVPCELVNYEISVKIECRTGGVNHEITAPVKVFNDAGFTESSVQFQFKDIQLIGLHPRVGPKSGGTQISLMWKYLNIGSNIRAFLDEYECHINMTKASSSRLTCATSEATQPEPIRTLRLFVDGANRTYTCENHSERPINAYDHQLVTTRRFLDFFLLISSDTASLSGFKIFITYGLSRIVGHLSTRNTFIRSIILLILDL